MLAFLSRRNKFFNLPCFKTGIYPTLSYNRLGSEVALEKNSPANGDARLGFNLWVRKFPGVGNGNSL